MSGRFFMIRMTILWLIITGTVPSQTQSLCVAMPPGKLNQPVRQAIIKELAKRKVLATDCEEQKAAVELNWYPQPMVEAPMQDLFMITAVPVPGQSTVLGTVSVWPEPTLAVNGYILWLEQNGQVLYRDEHYGSLQKGLTRVSKYLTKRGTCISGFCVKQPK